MVVKRIHYPWKPDLQEMATRLSIKEGDRAVFESAFACASITFLPYVLSRQLSINAIGDGFVMLSGEWFEDSRLAKCLAQATGVWAFYASAGVSKAESSWSSILASVATYDALTHHTLTMQKAESARVDAISTNDSQAIRRLLGILDDQESEAMIGILFAEPIRAGACCHDKGCNNCSHHCGREHARNTNE